MDLSEIYKPAQLDELTRGELDRLKLLPGGHSFICECHDVEIEISSLDRHHRIPQEVGGTDTAENIAYLCVGCHQLLHRLAMRMMSTKAHKQTPLEIAQTYANRVNPAKASSVVANLLALAQLVTMYKIQKADKAIAPPDGAIVVADMPNEYKALFKQIAWEIKRGDQRGLGMTNLAAIAVLQLVSRHRPEKKEEIDAWISSNILYVKREAKVVWQTHDLVQEHTL